MAIQTIRFLPLAVGKPAAGIAVSPSPIRRLVEWLREYRVHCRVHGPYYPILGFYLTPLNDRRRDQDGVLHGHVTRINIEPIWG